MTETLNHPNVSINYPPTPQNWLKLLVVGILANVALWSAALIYLQATKPTYTSDWSATLPSAGSYTSINLPDIGNTTSQDRTPYDSPNLDPRENYKFIATSSPVIQEAARDLGISLQEFGKPRVEIVDNTTLMEFEMQADTPEEAQQKAIALYNAFQQRLNQLRSEERTSRDSGVQTTLQDAQQKLEIAQQRLSEFKARSGLTSSIQVDQLSANIEDLRRQRAMLLADQQQINAQLGQLSRSLNVGAPQAADAFTLNADQVFQQNLVDYSEATAALDALSNQLGPNHPAIVRERTRQEAARAAMLRRGQTVLGRPVDESTLIQINLAGNETSSSRETLFERVITTQVDQQGATARATELNQQIAQLESRLSSMAQSLSQLEALSRDVTIAEAVFSSALTRLDLSSSDSFGSYPQIQLLTEPSLPGDASSPKATFVLLGTAMGSFLITTGLLSLWLRGRKRSIFEPISSLEPTIPASALHTTPQPQNSNGRVPDGSSVMGEVHYETK